MKTTISRRLLGSEMTRHLCLSEKSKLKFELLINKIGLFANLLLGIHNPPALQRAFWSTPQVGCVKR